MEKTVKLYIEHKKSPVRYYPGNIMEHGIDFRLEDFGVENEEYNIEDFYLGLECRNMTSEEVADANLILENHFAGYWEKSKYFSE